MNQNERDIQRKLRNLKYADEIGSTVKAISDVFSTIVSLE